MGFNSQTVQGSGRQPCLMSSDWFITACSHLTAPGHCLKRRHRGSGIHVQRANVVLAGFASNEVRVLGTV